MSSRSSPQKPCAPNTHRSVGPHLRVGCARRSGGEPRCVVSKVVTRESPP
jgi:hypothetical protein